VGGEKTGGVVKKAKDCWSIPRPADLERRKAGDGVQKREKKGKNGPCSTVKKKGGTPADGELGGKKRTGWRWWTRRGGRKKKRRKALWFLKKRQKKGEGVVGPGKQGGGKNGEKSA